MRNHSSKFTRWLVIAAALISGMPSLAHAAPTAAMPGVTLCVDDNFPPFEYADPALKKLGQHVVRGSTISLVNGILKPYGIPYQIKWYPFSRCMAEVEQGSIDVGLDAYYDPDRARMLTYSKPYFSLTPQYFYSKKRYPNGLNITSTQDLKKYKGCGIHGYSYLHYGLRAQDLFNNDSLSDAGLVHMVQYNRCDYFVEELEVLQGLALTEQAILKIPDLGHASVPGAESPQLYFFLSKSSQTTQWLLPILNHEISRLKAKGDVTHLVSAELRRNPGTPPH
jgi:polar amino acid transport system substrate-binding protein